MFDLDCLGNWLGDVLGNFSRSHCISICAFLIPANLIATSQTLLFTFWKRSPLQVLTMTAIASFYALLMISHVISWYAIGVVMAPTFILTFLGIDMPAACLRSILDNDANVEPKSVITRSSLLLIG